MAELSEYADFRRELSAFLENSWPADDRRAFKRTAIDRGYLGRSVPKRYGGSEQEPDPRKARIIGEEFRRAGAPTDGSIGMSMLVPTLLERGEEWQRERFVEATLLGDIAWCQGYSEPGAGSDLSSLRTSGVLDGDEWVINGQKIWTTEAHKADYMFALVRTERDVPPKQGISYLLVDMHQPGVDVRPLTQMTGTAEFNEVFLTDVRTPADWIVGGRGQGWSVANTTLKHERGGVGDAAGVVSMFQSLVKLARRRTLHGRAAIEDPSVRDRLVAIEGFIEAHRCSGEYQFRQSLRGESASPLTFMNKLTTTNIGKAIAELALEILGDAAMLAPVGGRGARSAGDERWLMQFMGSLGLSIAGGTSNIQRNIVAERGYGFPRDPYPLADERA